MNVYYIETTGMGSRYLWKQIGRNKLTLMAISLDERVGWAIPGEAINEMTPRLICGFRNIKKYAHTLKPVSETEAFLALL